MEHLEGITVLNEYIQQAPAPWTIIVFASTIFFGLIALLSIIFDNAEASSIFLIITLIVMIIGIIFMCVFTIDDGTIYECIVDDSVTFKELTKKYEVIEQRGNIYKLKFLTE